MSPGQIIIICISAIFYNLNTNYKLFDQTHLMCYLFIRQENSGREILTMAVSEELYAQKGKRAKQSGGKKIIGSFSCFVPQQNHCCF